MINNLTNTWSIISKKNKNYFLLILILSLIASLLEVGTGFHPDLTGRENVILNAALIGLSPETVEARLDDIFAYADIGEFIDQPVKNYSSGMYVRLGFAVTAFSDADVYIFDEVLAVGDVVVGGEIRICELE